MSGFLPGIQGAEGAVENNRLVLNPAGVLGADGYYLLEQTIPANIFRGMGGLVQIQVNGEMESDASDSYRICLDIFTPSNPPSQFTDVMILANSVATTSGDNNFFNMEIDVFPCAGGTLLDVCAGGFVLDVTSGVTEAFIDATADDYPTNPSPFQQMTFRIALRDTVTFTPPPFNVTWTTFNTLLRTVSLAP